MGEQQLSTWDTLDNIEEEGSIVRKFDSTCNSTFREFLLPMPVLDAMKNNRSLVSVRLIAMAIPDKYVDLLRQFISNNPCLRYLYLDGNSLSGGSVVQLLTAVNEKNRLRYFSALHQTTPPLSSEEEEAVVEVVEDSRTLYRVGVDISDARLRERLESRLSRNRRRICGVTMLCNLELLCPFELPDLPEGCYLFQWCYPLQWLRAVMK